MKLVIDISEEDFKFIKGLRLALCGRGYAQELQRNVINAIRNGTPLPEEPDKVKKNSIYGEMKENNNG